MSNTSLIRSTFKKFRAKCFNLILYPEWSNIDDILLKLTHENFTFLGISPLHDKDVYEDGPNAGKPKKPHYHVVIQYASQTWSSAIANRTGIPHQYKIFEKTDDFEGSVAYLNHANAPHKYQYDADDVYVSDVTLYRDILDRVEKYGNLHELSKKEQFSLLWYTATSGQFHCLGDFTEWVYSIGLEQIFHKNKIVFRDYFWKHGW